MLLTAVEIATSVLNIVTDMLIIGLPINEIRRLQLPLVKKLLLCALFSLGIFVIACTVIRMITVSPQTTASDQTCQSTTIYNSPKLVQRVLIVELCRLSSRVQQLDVCRD